MINLVLFLLPLRLRGAANKLGNECKEVLAKCERGASGPGPWGLSWRRAGVTQNAGSSSCASFLSPKLHRLTSPHYSGQMGSHTKRTFKLGVNILSCRSTRFHCKT